MIINLISGPRNISTALMYSFSQHSNIKVIDEPFYAYYLERTGLTHPGREEIMEDMSSNANTILKEIEILSSLHNNLFIKNMAHHHEGLDLSYLSGLKNVFLIRDPKQLIASFAQVIPKPTIQDIGLKHEADLLDYIIGQDETPMVIDSNDILNDPRHGLKKLCNALEIPFEEEMLSWKQGPIAEDGIWAKYWYKNVHNSTGFTKQTTSNRPLPENCETLYNEALPYYEKLKEYCLDFQ